jgi:hypothetical protein
MISLIQMSLIWDIMMKNDFFDSNESNLRYYDEKW